MPQLKAPIQVNQFVGGIVTEANPLNFPVGASLDEQNMILNRDGSRSRRLGFDKELGGVDVNTTINTDSNKIMARGQFRWINPGGIPSKQLIVVQIGNYIAIHDVDADSISSGLIWSRTFDASLYDTTFSFASVNGYLVVATNQKNILTLNYVDDEIVSGSTRIKVRDFWGVEATPGGQDLEEGGNIQIRPTVYDEKHIYNLRNQTYALPKMTQAVSSEYFIDMISDFYSRSGGRYPSNADNAIYYIFANPDANESAISDRYHATLNYQETPYTTPSPRGYFVIDVLQRSRSRREEIDRLYSNNPVLSVQAGVDNDSTEGGATVVASYAGRFWFSGFSGKNNGGDSRSPSLDSYVMFSKLVDNIKDIGKCYQEADPTSPDDSNLVDTDGGYVRLDGAYGIKAMVNFGSSLFVLASNGVWEISGLDNDSFTATGYSVRKLSEEGCISRNSVVTGAGSIFYWSQSGIYVIQQDAKTGSWFVTNMTKSVISELYSEITSTSKYSSVGYFDSDNDKITWVYGDDPTSGEDVKELVYDLKFQVFTRNVVSTTGLISVKGISSVSGGQSASLSNEQGPVTLNSEQITVNDQLVTVVVSNSVRTPSSSFYCIITDVDPIKYTFGGYINDNLYDWTNTEGSIDTPAFITTGPIVANESRTRKSVPYLTTFFKVTEEPEETLKSSCRVSSRWDWTNSIGSNRWSTKRQAYRKSRPEDGYTIISTRNAVRGSGQSVSFRFDSEPGKDMHIYGWSFTLLANGNE